MIRDHAHRSNRSAFTLIELVVVLLIIAILASLVISVTVTAMGKLSEVKTRTEITQLEVGLRGFMSDYNLDAPPPSKLVLYENISLYAANAANPVVAQSHRFLQKTFGKNLGIGQPYVDWNGDGLPNGPWTLEGEQSLVFYLGGIPTAPGLTGFSPQGFSTNKMNPAIPGGNRKGPYFTFDTSRLMPPPAAAVLAPTFPVYIDPWQTKTGAFFAAATTVPGVTLGGTPYAYFSCNGINNGYSITDCSSIGALPYWTAQIGNVPTVFTDSNTYQIISAGKDGAFGFNPTAAPPNNYWIPASGAIGTGADDQSNFSAGLLGKGQQ